MPGRSGCAREAGVGSRVGARRVQIWMGKRCSGTEVWDEHGCAVEGWSGMGGRVHWDGVWHSCERQWELGMFRRDAAACKPGWVGKA